MDTDCDLLSCQYLLPSMIVWTIIWTYWLHFCHIETRPLGKAKPSKIPELVASVSNWSKVPVRFRVQFRPGTRLLEWVFTQNLLLKSQHALLQLSIGVLIISQNNINMKYAVWCPLSSPMLRFAIRSIVVKSRWKPGHFGLIFGLISQRLNDYWSDRKSENRRWNRASICTFHI